MLLISMILKLKLNFHRLYMFNILTSFMLGIQMHHAK